MGVSQGAFIGDVVGGVKGGLQGVAAEDIAFFPISPIFSLYSPISSSGMFEQLLRPNLTDFFIFFAKRTWHTQFLAGKFFSGSKKNFIPPKLAVFWEFRHFPRIEGPFPKFTSFDNLFFAQEIVWKPSVILLLCLSHPWKLLVPLS